MGKKSNKVNGSQLKLIKELSIIEELKTSILLIKLGLGEYQNLNTANDFYYLPFQLFSSGFERLMKCHICLGYYEINNSYPSANVMRKPGHDLLKLKKMICDQHFLENDIPALKEDKVYLTTNTELEKTLELLSEFGKIARYYNIDIITSGKNIPMNVQKL